MKSYGADAVTLDCLLGFRLVPLLGQLPIDCHGGLKHEAQPQRYEAVVQGAKVLKG